MPRNDPLIRRGAALRALKIRTYDKTSTEVFAQVSAAAYNISFADVMPRLEAGDLNAVAGKIDERDLSSSSPLGQPSGQVVGDRVARGRLIGEQLDLVGRKTAKLGIAQDACHRLRVARSVTERPDLLLMQILADPDQDCCPVAFARSRLHRSA